MKILGICGSPRPEKISATYRVMDVLLKETGHEYELVSLRNLKFSGCTACLGCAKDNVCRIHDDLFALRDKIISADAFVIGSPNYFSGMSSLAHAFLERWFQFRHQEGKLVWGKLAVAVGVGSMGGSPVVEQIEKFMAYNLVKTVDTLSVNGNPSCFYCGYGKTCEMGVPRMMGIGCPEPSSIPDILDNPDIRKAAAEAGARLGRILSGGYDRRLVALEMQELLSDCLKENV
ncbi:MAG TPA: flavodoxin family protein [Lentisphaeria bacterium]|nr:MAG: NADPH-dependent FMN reductase [Lentisphaerae bacterium GWF2_50_93]HCE45767.1 flavodoxin family protein [Lentisphaeria bacterium]